MSPWLSAANREAAVPLQDRIQRQGPKKLLAIDGGGIRGVLSLEVLQAILSDRTLGSVVERVGAVDGPSSFGLFGYPGGQGNLLGYT